MQPWMIVRGEYFFSRNPYSFCSYCPVHRLRFWVESWNYFIINYDFNTEASNRIKFRSKVSFFMKSIYTKSSSGIWFCLFGTSLTFSDWLFFSHTQRRLKLQYLVFRIWIINQRIVEGLMIYLLVFVMKILKYILMLKMY